MKTKFTLLICLLISWGAHAQLTTAIRLNQVGFFVNGPKIAAVINTSATTFAIKSTDRAMTFYTGNLTETGTWSSSGENVKIADFSNYNLMGKFVIDIAGLGYSYTFTIGNDMLVDVNKKLIKAFYFQRCSAELPAQYAGIWARKAGHPDNDVIIHPSAASAGRPAGTVISSPKGWYDAGDYNLYLTNSGIAVYSMLAAYEQYSSYFDTLKINIPESGNTLPDLLDQVKWNTDWMLSMQDPADGGVYFKKTDPNFDAWQILPEYDKAKRYVCKKTTSSALNFAASMAVTYRVFKTWDDTYATQCLNAAKAAYEWAIANPNVLFANPAAEGTYPAIVTGDYLDTDLSDELEWAATELYIATKDESYYVNAFKNNKAYILPNWNRVRTLGLISLAYHRKDLTAIGFADTAAVKAKVIAMATTYSEYQKNDSPYKIVMGQAGNAQFEWGSNGFAARQSFILLNAYQLNGNRDFLDAALSNVDYILGRNAVGYSFITGIGSKRVMDIHHAMSKGDGVADPIPGWMAGGPSNINYDGCVNYANTPAISYIDKLGCYTKNEGDINWNAAAVYATAATATFRSYNNEMVTSTETGIAQVKIITYPNPFTSSFQINGLTEASDYALVDTSGRIVQKGRTDGTITVNAQPGIYQLILFRETGNQVYKVVKVD
jgi:endoglucanase